jgi:hypothetical protein
MKKIFRLLSLTALFSLLTSCQPLSFNADVSSAGQNQVPVMLYWTQPVERENGDAMTPSEIGGYEIRYKTGDQDKYTSIIVTGNSLTQYSIELPASLETYVEVAVFDTNGIYGNFVAAKPK